jgi:hypothetical protein
MSNTAALVRIFAAWFIVLGISPFTAPFATCDLDLLHSGSHASATAVKTVTDPDETLAIPATFQFAAPCSGAIAIDLAATVDSSPKASTSPQVLRL